MILIALGAHPPSAGAAPARGMLEAALDALDARGIRVRRQSSWFESAPVAAPGSAWTLSAVAAVASEQGPHVVARHLLDVAASLAANGHGSAAPGSVVTLELLAYHGWVSGPDAWPPLPHPELARRVAMLAPLAELQPDWVDPRSGRTARSLLRALPPEQRCLRRPETSRPRA
jgi:2-amino-4-hydroxy-6-hydroxymethyldihydropteridine diphosphokinase